MFLTPILAISKSYQQIPRPPTWQRRQTMYAIIIKEAAEYVIIDAYYKGRWRCDEKALKAYLAYMSGFDR